VNDEVEVDDDELDHEGLCDEDDTASKGQATNILDHVRLLKLHQIRLRVMFHLKWSHTSNN